MRGRVKRNIAVFLCRTTSLAPLLTGTRKSVRESVFGAYKSLQRMVRTERWKLIRYPYARRTQLFDIKRDPWETKDLSNDPRRARLIKGLNARLREWQEQTGDELDMDNPPPRRSA